MIKLFRKIRQKLISENRVSKYLIYAVGEIVLVVIGILIALQINNWNEARNLAVRKVETLHEFQESLRSDLRKIEANMAINVQVKQSASLILDYMDKDLPYNDTLKYQFGRTVITWPIDIKVGVYQNYRSSNLGLISSTKLKQSISNVYETRYSNLKRFQNQYIEMINKASQDLLNTRFESFLDSNYETWKIDNNFASTESYNADDVVNVMVPVNFENLKNDQEYRYFLRMLINKYNWWVEIQAASMQEAINNLLTVIDNELENMDDYTKLVHS